MYFKDKIFAIFFVVFRYKYSLNLKTLLYETF
jgi:hypothetical protein